MITPAEKDRRDSYYKRKYGLTYKQVLEQYIFQQRRCGICRNEVRTGGVKIYHLDHDHGTGTPRGLLCASCNRLMGRVDRKDFFLSNLVLYKNNKGIWNHGC